MDCSERLCTMLGFETVKLTCVSILSGAQWTRRRIRTVGASYGQEPVLGTGWRIEERHVAAGRSDTVFSGYGGGGGE